MFVEYFTNNKKRAGLVSALALCLLGPTTIACAQSSPNYTSEGTSLGYVSNGQTLYAVSDFREYGTIPQDLLNYLNGVNPQVWGFGTNFTGKPDYVTNSAYKNYIASALFTDGFYGSQKGLIVRDATVTNMDSLLWWFQGRWNPASYASNLINGKKLWVIVIRKDVSGYHIIPSSSTPYAPSYYDIEPNGEDDVCSNGDVAQGNTNPNDGPSGNTSNAYRKLLNPREFVSRSSQTLTQWWVLEGNWTQNGSTYGVTLRDAQLMRLRVSTQNISLGAVPVYSQLP